jgi:hypothetical protein
MPPRRWDTYASTSGALEVDDRVGRIVLAAARPGVQVVTIWGHLTPAMSRAITSHASAQLNSAPYLVAFHNWREMTGYESSCRGLLTQWAMRHKHDSKLHLVFGSPIVAMGVTVANLALGNVLQVHMSLDSMLATMESELRAR